MVANPLLAHQRINLIMSMPQFCYKSTLSPAQLLSELQQLEQLAGRIRLERWGARTLDLDILLYDQQVIDTEQLIVPHKELVNRCFVTLPLLDINPTLTLPNGVKVSSLACATYPMIYMYFCR